MKMLRSRTLALASAALVTGISGCGVLLGLGDFKEGPGSGGAGGSGGATTTSTTSSDAGGSGGTGGGGTGGVACMPVAETCASPADEDCDGHDCVRWAALFGTGGDQTVGGVAVDGAGNVFIAGVFSGTLPLDASNTLTATGDDVYLAKLDPTGKVLWSKSFSAATKPKVSGVAVDSSGKVAIVGSVDGSINFGAGVQSLNFTAEGEFIAEFQPDGKLIWGVLSDVGDSVDVAAPAFDAAGNVVTSGKLIDKTNFLTSLWLEKRDPGGGVVLYKTFDTMGGGGSIRVGGLAVDPTDDNRILLGGSFQGTVSFGAVALTSAGGLDAFLLECDAAGAVKLRKQFGGAGDQAITSVAFDADGNRVVLGTLEGTVNFGGVPAAQLSSAGGKDIFVAKLNLSYAQLWARAFGDASDQISARLAVTSAGDILFTGTSSGNVDYGGGVIAGGGGLDLPLVKLQAKDGAHLWSKVFGDAADQAGVTLAAMPDNGVVLGGDVAGSLDVGTGAKTSAGGVDILLTRFAP